MTSPTTPATDAVIRVDALRKTYGELVAVDGVSFEVRAGEVFGLLGPNGAGKTTTFYMVVGLTRPDSGTVLLDDENITGLPMYMRARQGIGYLPQEASVFRRLTAEQNVLAVLEARNRQLRQAGNAGAQHHQDHVHVADIEGDAAVGARGRFVLRPPGLGINRLCTDELRMGPVDQPAAKLGRREFLDHPDARRG